MRRTYERPVIKKLQTPVLNPFGLDPQGKPRVRSAIDGVAVEDLVRQFGSPLFVYSERLLRQKVRHAMRTFRQHYEDVVFAWSYRTSYLKAICALMHEEGSCAAVISAMEYEKARALGLPGERIVFNGPYKPVDVLAAAVAERAIINVDHLDEAFDLEQIADRRGRPIAVGLSVNLQAGAGPQACRLGINLESDQALDAVRRIARGRKLHIAGLHCHLGTCILEPDAYRLQVQKLLEFAYTIEDHFGFRIEVLDLGGGFPSRSTLKRSFYGPDIAVPSLDDYAEAIGEALHAYLRPRHRPQLILEAGRALIDDAGFLISSVVASKPLADGTPAYVLDAGTNLLPTAFWYRFRMETERELVGMPEPSMVYGPQCMNIDCLDEGVPLPPLERGDRLILSPVGAYSTSQWQQFVHHRPNVVLIGLNGQAEVIREAEELADLERHERLPEHLCPSALTVAV